MEFEITNILSEKLLTGINIYQEIQIKKKQRLNNFIKEELSSILENHLKKMPASFDLSRKLYREFHIDPTKYRPSSEALWRRLKNKGDFPNINSYVNITNLLSLKFQICFGLYDITKIKGNIVIDIGNEADEFQGIRKDLLHLKGKIVLKDSEGAFGNPSSDSLRTCVDTSTTHILQILFFHIEDPDATDTTRKAFNTFKEFFEVHFSKSYLL